jgi:membrane-associated protease RseP (regulator of RpoE activity)
VEPAREELSFTPLAPEYVWHPRPKFQDRRWLHLLLFVLTVTSTTWIGAYYYFAGFVSEFSTRQVTLSGSALLLRGLWYSGTVLAILGSHEFGHYFACRYYDVDASLPYFLPFPLPPSGTLGAVIRIREPIPSKRILFDIGVAGPIAGFALAVPALAFGMAMSHVVRMPPANGGGLEFGEPLLFQLVSKLFLGTPPPGYVVNTHPMAFGAWFGLLATSLNLFPIGQLDGGHISYAVLGRKSSYVTLGMLVVTVGLVFFSVSWLVTTVLLIGMLMMFGRHHPRTFDEHVPLDHRRKLIALFAVIMFVLCFTPAPLRVVSTFR